MPGPASSTTSDVLAGVDLSGRTFVITGAAGGLGFEAARALGAAGARIVIADRRRDRADEAARRLGGDAEARQVDLSISASVRTLAEDLLRDGDRIDGLVNNAGVVRATLERTDSGAESTLATNFIGHFLLTGLLLPRLRQHPGARIVNLSSGAHRDSAVDFDDPHYRHRPYDPRTAYAQSKSATALFTLGLAKRLRGSGVEAFTVRPAKADTGIFAALSDTERARFSTRVNAKQAGEPLEVAAATTVWACVAPELAGHSGAYLSAGTIAGEPGQPGEPGAHADWIFDPVQADRLWALAEFEVGQKFSGDDWRQSDR
jgi:NAD(P)-dependent dehydrogenase (short-subunit alcohol dehydrogenase family)